MMRRNLRLLLFSILALMGTNAFAQNRIPTAASKPEVIADSRSASLGSFLGKVRLLESVSYRIGWTLEPGEFYHLPQECLKRGTVEDFTAMLGDENRFVRVMGLVCLAKSVNSETFTEVARPLFADDTPVRYTNGCVLNQSATVGLIARRLAENSFFHTEEGNGTVK